MELDIKEQTYRIGKLNGFQQFHVSRKIAPLLFTLGGTTVRIGDIAKLTSAEALLAFGPLAETLSKMPDAECEYVINVCLDVCHRKQGEGWAKVRSGGSLMFDDIDMVVLLQLTVAVIRGSLSNFFPDALPKESTSLKRRA